MSTYFARPIGQFWLVVYNQFIFIGFEETFSRWTVHFFSLLFIGQFSFVFHLVTIRVVNLLEWTETGLITGSDQTVRVVHSCNRWIKRNNNLSQKKKKKKKKKNENAYACIFRSVAFSCARLHITYMSSLRIFFRAISETR